MSSIELPEGMIQNAIAVAIAEAFTPEQRDRVIRDVVRAHLTAKSDAYGRETILSNAIGDTIREIARKEVTAIIEGPLAERVRAEVRASLGERFQDTTVLALHNALQNVVLSNLRIVVGVE